MENERKIGGKIHALLNKTLIRKLTFKEHKSAVEHIQALVEAARENARNDERKERLLEALAELENALD